jgi:hypothetical protein
MHTQQWPKACHEPLLICVYLLAIVCPQAMEAMRDPVTGRIQEQVV